MRRLLPVGVLAAFLSGCETLTYPLQAASGQWSLVTARQPLDAVINDVDTDPALRRQLQLVTEMRAFAREQLGMTDIVGYDHWVQLPRDYPVWNVVAAPEFSLDPQTWCFPVAGCVAYRGYFNETDARHFAGGLDDEGFDTWVYGVAAYSTLGWFDDPVLSSWVWRDQAGLAALLFHELAHQQVYIAGDTALSESFASVVEREGVKRWLRQQGDEDAYRYYLARLDADERFNALLEDTRSALEQLYQSSLSMPAMRAEKARIIALLRQRFEQARAQDAGLERFDRWMSGPINNARLAGVGSYHRHIGALRQMLLEQGNDLAAFYRRVDALAASDPDVRERELAEYAAGSGVEQHREFTHDAATRPDEFDQKVDKGL